MAVPKGTSVGIDLSNPVRFAAFSEATGAVVAVATAKTPFDPASKPSLTSLAKEIREFCRPLRSGLHATASLPFSDCLLFTVPMPNLNPKEFKAALQLEVSRLAPEGSDNMRAVARKWPSELPPPPSVKVPQGNSLYIVAAATAGSVLAAESVMKMAGLKPLGVEIPATPMSRASWWLWSREETVAQLEAAAAKSPDGTEAKTAGSSEATGQPDRADSTYAPWVMSGNVKQAAGTSDASAEPNQQGGGAAELAATATPETASSEEAVVKTILDISIVANPNEALMHLSFCGCPWLMREIPLDPSNLFVNGQILAGEVARSARFARTSVTGSVSGRVTVCGEPDRVSFLVDFLKEQAGLSTRAWGRPYCDCESEYGVAVGLAIQSEGGANQ